MTFASLANAAGMARDRIWQTMACATALARPCLPAVLVKLLRGKDSAADASRKPTLLQEDACLSM